MEPHSGISAAGAGAVCTPGILSGSMSARGASAATAAGLVCPGESAEIPLSEDIFNALIRRRGRRLHAIQAGCQASLRIDRAKGILHVSAREPGGLQAVMAQLAVVSAPRKPVSGAVWAELMRTRMFETNSPSATLSQLQ